MLLKTKGKPEKSGNLIYEYSPNLNCQTGYERAQSA